MSFRNLGIKQKLLISFLVVVTLSVITSSFAMVKIMGMRDNAKEMKESWVPSLKVMGWLNGAVSDVQRLALALALETDSQQMAKIEQDINQTLKDIEQKRQVYEKDLISDPEERKLYGAFFQGVGSILVAVNNENRANHQARRTHVPSSDNLRPPNNPGHTDND